MELTAAGTPFLYFPLQEPFRAEFPRRASPRSLWRGNAHGFRDVDAGHDCRCDGWRLRAPAKSRPVEADGPSKAAAMIAELL
jgi:hypothetical protein